MYKPFTRRALSIALLCAAFVAAPTWAGKSDFDQPIQVDAKSQFVDGKNKTSLFKEDVHITQGSLTIDADEVEVIATAGEGKEIFIARGQPAVYSQTMDDGAKISASANEIKYQVETRTISLAGNAELQQDTSKVTGELITFDMIKEQLLAQGTDNQDGRVTTIFSPDSLPKKKDKEDKENNQ